jgi:hypothetical protein
MMRCYIVVEDKQDAALIRALLKSDFDLTTDGIKIVEGNGYSGAESLTRTLLITRQQPVILVVNADSNDPRERQQFLESSIGQYADRRLWKVLVAVPALESILFTDRSVVESLVETEASDLALIQGQYEPKKALERLSPGITSEPRFSERIAQVDLTPLSSHEFVRNLKASLAQFMTPPTMALVAP